MPVTSITEPNKQMIINKIILYTFLLLALKGMTLNLCFANIQHIDNKRDSGQCELIIDISKLENQSGKFMVMVGGQMFFPEVKNNSIRINTLLEEPRRGMLGFYPNDVINKNPNKRLNEIAVEIADSYTFLAETGQSYIMTGTNVGSSIITNESQDQQEYVQLLTLKNDFYKVLESKYIELVKEYENTTKKDSLIRSSLMSFRSTQFPIYYEDNILNFIRDRPNTPASAIELDDYCYSENMNIQTLQILYNNLSERIKNLPTARRVNRFITSKAFADDLLHKVALDFKQLDTKGKELKLDDYKGKYVLLEFWASWCGYCREEFPFLKGIYDKYNSKNFEIIGISLDTDREKWLKAIQNDKLIWPNVSDLKGWNNEVAKLYKITGVPSNFLIDPRGKVIGYNLNKEELSHKLREINSPAGASL